MLIQARVEKNGEYSWRSIPQTESCDLLASARAPDAVSDVSITTLEFDEIDGVLNLTLELSPPENVYGHPVRYEVILLTAPTDCPECGSSNISRFLVICQMRGSLLVISFSLIHVTSLINGYVQCSSVSMNK